MGLIIKLGWLLSWDGGENPIYTLYSVGIYYGISPFKGIQQGA